MGQRKLESIGIIINVERLMKENRPNENVLCVAKSFLLTCLGSCSKACERKGKGK